MAIDKNYKNAIARLNRAKGVKSGQKGYITPSQAQMHTKKYKDISAIENEIKKVKIDIQLKPYIKQYNKYMGYRKGENGYLTTAKARNIGIENVKDYAEQAQIKYGEQIRREEYNKKRAAGQKAVFTRLSNQAAKDTQSLKQEAQQILLLIEKQNSIYETLKSNTSNDETQLKALSDLRTTIKEKAKDFFEKRKKIIDKNRKLAGLPLTSNDLHLEEIKIGDIKKAAEQIINGYSGKDKYGKPLTLYSKYKEESDKAISTILNKFKDTNLKIGNKSYTLSDIADTKFIHADLFWKAFHAWEKNGSNLVALKGKRNYDFASASAFFDTADGNAFIQSILPPDLKGLPIQWDI